MTKTAAGSIAASPAPEPAERFAASLARLMPEDAGLGLAVSGGPDSMAMLLLAHAAIPGRFEVATVDHGLRPEARDECALVEAACTERDIPCAVLKVRVGEGNLQEQARIARYEALVDWAAARGLGALATAHHADDQAETLIMRLNRGSGIAGLAGVREGYWSEHYIALIIRPLLGFRRAELAGIVEAAGLKVAHDPSNDDERFDRVRIRRKLAEADWLDPLAIAQSALNLAEANEALDYVANQLWETGASRDGGTVRLRLHPERAIRLRLIERAIRELGGAPRGGDVARLDSAIVSGKKANLAGIMVEPALTEEGPFLLFSPEPPRRTG